MSREQALEVADAFVPANFYEFQTSRWEEVIPWTFPYPCTCDEADYCMPLDKEICRACHEAQSRGWV